jgi:hypothetical protein
VVRPLRASTDFSTSRNSVTGAVGLKLGRVRSRHQTRFALLAYRADLPVSPWPLQPQGRRGLHWVVCVARNRPSCASTTGIGKNACPTNNR